MADSKTLSFKAEFDADKLKKDISELAALGKWAAAEFSEALETVSAGAAKVGSGFETAVSKAAAGSTKLAAVSGTMTVPMPAQISKVSQAADIADNFSRLSDLKKCLDSSGVDAHGNIIGNYESVKKVVSLINEIYPEKINIADGKIQDYEKLSESIDSYIEKLREEASAESDAAAKRKSAAYKFASEGNDAVLKNTLAVKNNNTKNKKSDTKKTEKKENGNDPYENDKQSAENEIQIFKDKWKNINRLEQIGLLTEEEVLKKRKEVFSEYFPDFDPKNDCLTDAYEYYKQIYDDETALTEEALKKQEKIVDNGLSDILKRYQKAYDDLEKKRENYRQKLLSIGGDVFSVTETKDENGNKNKTYTVNNIDGQIKKMREYHANIKALKEQGISDSLLEELTSMKSEDSARFTKYLSGMSDAEFGKINSLYKEKDAVADELSNDLYKSEAQKISDSMTVELADLAVSAYDYGAQSAEQFSAGFNDAVDKLGIDALYGQYQAAGATKVYENYASASKDDREFFITVDVTGKSNIYLDSEVIGTAVTNQQAKQKARTGG